MYFFHRTGVYVSLVFHNYAVVSISTYICVGFNFFLFLFSVKWYILYVSSREKEREGGGGVERESHTLT